MKRLLFVALAVALSAAAEPQDETFGLKNGRYWASMPPESRRGFAAGLLDGWNMRGWTEATVHGSVLGAFSGGEGFTTDALAGMITSVYADKHNLVLPIGVVGLACLAIERGEVTRDGVLKALRLRIADLRFKKESSAFDPVAAIRHTRSR